MQFNKVKLFLFLNGVIALMLVCYFALWLSATIATAKIIAPYYATKVNVTYVVNGKVYKKSYMRNDVPYGNRTVSIRYLLFAPSSSRIHSFMGIAAEPLAWWFVFLVASAMLLLTDNVVFSRGTVFRFHKKFPWISVEEYFKLPWNPTFDDSTPSPPSSEVNIKKLEN